MTMTNDYIRTLEPCKRHRGVSGHEFLSEWTADGCLVPSGSRILRFTAVGCAAYCDDCLNIVKRAARKSQAGGKP